MCIAELSADLRFRSLYLRDVVFGKPDSEVQRIDYKPLDSDRPTGSTWVVREVAYMQPQVFPPDSCEGDAHTEEPPEHLRPTGDFPHFWGMNFGVLTRRSYDALRELIAPFVEFLPLDSEDGEFIAFKVLRFADALDSEKSVIDWFPQLKKDAGKPRLARRIKRYVFREELLAGEVIFRIPEMPWHSCVFVTQTFINQVRASNLEGFNFREVWPPVDPSIERQKYMAKRQRKQGRKP